MKSTTTWLLEIFMVMFAGFRVILTITNQQGSPLAGLVIENIALEITLIFLTLLCLVLLAKRNILGGIIYAVSNVSYYGYGLLNIISSSLVNGQTVEANKVLEILISAIGILLPLMVLAVSIERKSKKAEWFYKNEQFDRIFDERTDRNEYRFYWL